MSREIARKTAQSTPDEAHERREKIIELKRYTNRFMYGLGGQLEAGHCGKDWLALGYESEDDWLLDPQGIGLKPRTARFYRLIYRQWLKIFKTLGLTEDDLQDIDYTKIPHVAKAIDAGKDKDEILTAIEEAKTLTWRELYKVEQQDTHHVLDGIGKIHKLLDERSGYIIHISQFSPDQDASAQNYWDIFGNKMVEISIKLKK